MDVDSLKVSFSRDLGRVLSHLYDPNVLRRSSLLSLFGLDGRSDAMSALQHVLTDAIESLKPEDGVPPGSNAWRVYRVLYYRYTEQFTQHEVASDLGLSTRQVRRQERVAVQVLADYLWAFYALEHKVHLVQDVTEVEDVDPSTSARMPSREQELEWLERTTPSEMVDAALMLSAVLEIIQPLAQTLNVSLTHSVPEDLPALSVRRTTVRQALLHVITVVVRCASGGRVHLSAEPLPQRACVHIQVSAQHDRPLTIDRDCTDSLSMARELFEMSGGALQVTPDAVSQVSFSASVVLPAADQVSVLVIDDNVDTLKLIQRYLSSGRYRFIGASDPREALTVAAQSAPAIIVLDVMLPEIDGWELLGRLREHPTTSNTPIIVCTILPHHQLALTLGAAEFIRKPVSRRAFLATLDRQTSRLLRESRLRP
jgi:CheY-like chemotaxis protein